MTRAMAITTLTHPTDPEASVSIHDDEFTILQRDHVPDAGAEQFCWECDDEWPCIVFRLVEEISQLRDQVGLLSHLIDKHLAAK